MRLSKVESLRKDIEVVSQNHERDVDRKDAIIQVRQGGLGSVHSPLTLAGMCQMLDRDVEEAEEQYQMALRAHLQNIDALIDLQVGLRSIRLQRGRRRLTRLVRRMLACLPWRTSLRGI